MARHGLTRRAALVLALIGTLLSTSLIWTTAATASSPSRPPATAQTHRALVPHALAGHRLRDVCAAKTGPTLGRHVRCLASQDADVQVSNQDVSANSSYPQGYWPADLQAAYGLPSGSRGAGMTVAIVDGYDSPTIESDLAVYRQHFNLPPCTSSNGCFTKVNENGAASPLPPFDLGWAEEISLDVEMVSAACPLCNIVLVEADITSDDITHLEAAEDTAASYNPVAISNSFGGAEASTEKRYDDPHFTHSGMAVVAASGDDGYGSSYPAASPSVVAVGGTTLVPDSTMPRGWRESAWNGAGSGCAQYEPKPAWQIDTGCANRTATDLAVVADTNTGVAVYTRSPYGDSRWGVFGGTSVGSPLVAAMYALAGRPAAGANPAQFLYESPLALTDVTYGSNGTCTPYYLCHAVAGYDGPTGNGTPIGVAAFRPPATVPGSFTPISPRRILDTRDGTGGVPGPVGSGSTVRVRAGGLAGVPASGVAAVVLNVTVTGPTSSGYVTAFPDGQPRPTASNLNFVAGQTVPNSVIAPVSADGWFDLYTFAAPGASVQLVADISGYYLAPGPAASGTFGAVTPGRVLDTRSGMGAAGPVPANGTIRFKATGKYGVPGSGVGAVVLNVTVTDPTASGFVTAFPDGRPRPTASNLNFVPGQTVPNLVVVPVSADGYVDLYNSAGNTHLIADVSGYWLSGKPFSSGALAPINPGRILDTRYGLGAPAQPVGPGGTIRVRALGNYGVPTSGVSAVVLNVTVTGPTAAGFETAYPADQPRPLASNLNFVAGQTVPNAVVVPLSSDGSFSLFNSAGATDLIADICGYVLS